MFKCGTGHVTWYYKKHGTLLIQGKDGESLREKCVTLWQTKELTPQSKLPDKGQVLGNIYLVNEENHPAGLSSNLSNRAEFIDEISISTPNLPK